MEKEIRRNQNTLYIVGTGVIAIGIWSILKTSMFALFRFDSFIRWLGYGVNLQEDEFFVVYVVVAVIVALDLAVRAYVGLTARAEGRGEARRPVYLAFAALLALGSFLSICTFIYQMTGMAEQAADVESAENMGAAVLVELTSFITLCEMIISGIRIRRLQKTLREKE